MAGLRMKAEKLEKDLEGTGCGLNDVLIAEFACRD
jgi:hypothetical protein